MGVRSAMKDQARVVQKQSTGRKVEGSELFGETHGAWFPCRLTQEQAPKRNQQGRKQIVNSPMLFFDVTDENGEAVDLTGDMTVEVESPRQNITRQRFRLAGDPQPITKKVKLIAYQVTIERVNERPTTGVR